MTTKFKKSFSPMLICWNDIKIHLGFEDSYLVPPPTFRRTRAWAIAYSQKLLLQETTQFEVDI